MNQVLEEALYSIPLVFYSKTNKEASLTHFPDKDTQVQREVPAWGRFFWNKVAGAVASSYPRADSQQAGQERKVNERLPQPHPPADCWESPGQGGLSSRLKHHPLPPLERRDAQSPRGGYLRVEPCFCAGLLAGERKSGKWMKTVISASGGR